MVDNPLFLRSLVKQVTLETSLTSVRNINNLYLCCLLCHSSNDDPTCGPSTRTPSTIKTRWNIGIFNWWIQIVFFDNQITRLPFLNFRPVIQTLSLLSTYLTCSTNWDLTMETINLQYCKILTTQYVLYRSYVMLKHFSCLRQILASFYLWSRNFRLSNIEN